MRSFTTFFIRFVVLLVVFLIWPISAEAVDPDCIAPAPLASPPMWQNYCTNNPAATCDLGMTAWDFITHRSMDIRIGDSYSAGDERPRFFYDAAGDFYYTKIYSLIRNLESGPAASSEVSVEFAVTTDVAAALVDPTHISVSWQTIGTYQVHIPSSPHVFFPGAEPHNQFNAVCWNQPPNTLFPNKFVLRAIIIWPEDSNLTNNTVYSLYDLHEFGRPAQIAFAIDLSGSMGSVLPDGFTKLTLAKFRANQFVDLMENGHQLGVYGFDTGNTSNSSFTTLYKDASDLNHTRTLHETSEIFPIQTLTDSINRDTQIKLPISNQTDHGCTPVGQGLLKARKEIKDSSFPEAGSNVPSKAIVLFSDGLQNVPPYVNSPSTWECHPGTAGPDISVAHTFNDENFTIYSIYFGEEIGMGYNFMNDIKQQTGGDYVYGVEDDIGLAIAYYAIRGLVDDMIYLDEEGSVSFAKPSNPFTVDFDSAASEATVSVAWAYDNGATRLTMEHRKQGQTQWQPLEDIGVGYTSTTDNDPSPYRVYRFTPGADTTWEFRVQQLSPRRGSTRFIVAVFSEVEELQLYPSLGDEAFTAGDPLPIYADLISVGHPVLGAQVSAVVKVPTRPFSTTLRKYSGRFTATADPDSNKITGMIKQLKQFLLQDVNSDTLYLFKNVPVTLKDDGISPDKAPSDGVYSGELPGSDTRIAGRYEVTIKAQGSLPSGKTGERVTKLSTIANVGPADPDLSIIEIGPLDPRNDGTSVSTIRILPTDRFGNAAFPGSGTQIQVMVDGKPAESRLVDNLDTTFTQQIRVPTDRGAKVEVSVGEVSLVETSVGRPDLVEHRFEGSLHLGASIPHGVFADSYSGGFAAGLDYTLHIDRHLAARAELDLNWFDKKDDGTKILTNLNIYLQYRRPGFSRWTPYFEGGIGFYDLENSSNGLGFALGVGTYYRINNHWDLDFTARGNQVGGGLDLSFTQLLCGVVYKF